MKKMGFVKLLLAVFILAAIVSQFNISVDSNTQFIGMCILLAGAIAHSEK